MRVALNAWSLMSPHTGIASYTRNLILALRDLGEVEPLLFYGFSWSRALREAPIPGMGPLKAMVKRLLPAPYALTRALQQIRVTQGTSRLKPELYHEPSFLPFRFAGPTVVTVHDLSSIRYPDTHPKGRIKELEKRLPAAIASALPRQFAAASASTVELVRSAIPYRVSPAATVITGQSARGVQGRLVGRTVDVGSGELVGWSVGVGTRTLLVGIGLGTLESFSSSEPPNVQASAAPINASMTTQRRIRMAHILSQ
jgi:hypothetical protein